MLPAEGAPAHLRRQIIGKTLVMRAGRQTAGGDVRLARVQGERVPEAQAGAAKEISRFHLALKYGTGEAEFNFMLDHYVAVLQVTDQEIIVGDPLSGKTTNFMLD